MSFLAYHPKNHFQNIVLPPPLNEDNQFFHQRLHEKFVKTFHFEYQVWSSSLSNHLSYKIHNTDQKLKKKNHFLTKEMKQTVSLTKSSQNLTWKSDLQGFILIKILFFLFFLSAFSISCEFYLARIVISFCRYFLGPFLRPILYG